MTNPIAPIEPTDEQINDLRLKFGVTSNGRGIREVADVLSFTRAVLALAPAREKSEPAPVAQLCMSDQMRDFIEGMSVSVDVSTSEHDAGNRYFGTVTEVMDDLTDKHGVTLLVQNVEANFAAPTPAQGLSAAQVNSVWNACLRLLFSLTDQTGDEASARKPDDFIRGRAFEAKQIAKAMSSLRPEHCDDLRAILSANRAAQETKP